MRLLRRADWPARRGADIIRRQAEEVRPTA